jgi:hypothetical protein
MKIELYTKRRGGEVYMSSESLHDYTPDVKANIVTDKKELNTFNEKINGSPCGTLLVIKDLIEDYRITEEEFLEKDNCFKKLSLIYSNFGRVKHTIAGKEFEYIDIMGGIDKSTDKRVMANVLTQCREIYIDGCEVPLKLITFHRYRNFVNNENTIKWDVNDWGLFIYRNGRLTTIEPLQDDSLFGDKGRSHRQMEFGAILYAESVHDKYLNMPYSKFLSSSRKFNASLLSQLSSQLQKDISKSADMFAEEGNIFTTGSLKERGSKIAANLNKHLQNFKRSAKVKKTTPQNQAPKPNPGLPKPSKPRPKKEKKVKFIKEVRFDNFGVKSNLIDVYYNGDNEWSVNVNTGHPLFESMSLNDKKLECMIYYELSLSMSIENTFYTHDEETSRRLDNNRQELHDLQEDFIHEMEKNYDVGDTVIRVIGSLDGDNPGYETVNEEELTEKMAESPAE